MRVGNTWLQQLPFFFLSWIQVGNTHTHEHHHVRAHAFARALAWCRLPFSIAFQQQQGRARNKGCKFWKKDHQKREQLTSRPANFFNVSVWTKGGQRWGKDKTNRKKCPGWTVHCVNESADSQASDPVRKPLSDSASQPGQSLASPCKVRWAES